MFEGENKFVVANDSCIADVLRGKRKIEDVCFGCIIFLIKGSDSSDVEIFK